VNTIIEISKLDFAYGRQPVLEQIDLSIERGSIVGLIGPNGGGKTTLVKLLMGLLRPTGGSIAVNGLMPGQAVRRGDVIGYLPQNAARTDRFPLSVRQAVQLGLAGKTGMMHSYSRDDLAYSETLLERVGLADLAERPVGQLSGGQLQRVFIARALAPRPKVLLLDEPTTGIDRVGHQQFIEFLLTLKKEFELTVVIVSHDLRAVAAISDRIACLNLTLHYHDVPQRLPADLVFRMFACDLQAMGIGGVHKGCSEPGCDHGAGEIEIPMSKSQIPIKSQ
jgi:zinc transport system ATP-binding protein